MLLVVNMILTFTLMILLQIPGHSLAQILYWLRGTSTTLYQYDTQASAGSRWTQLANAPGSFGYGAGLVYKGGYLYALRGNNVNPNQLYRYNPGGNSWDTMATIPIDVYIGGFLADGGANTLYACKAENTKLCYQYSISGDSWTAIADAPDRIYRGGSAASNGLDRMYATAGSGTSSYTDGLYTYIYETASSSFEESGNYVSPTHDLSAVYKYANLAVTYTSATNTTLTPYTRSSADGITWNSWVEATAEKNVGTNYEYKVGSTPKRYLEVKFEFTSGNGIYSGIIDDYAINYYQDIDTPINPSDLDAYTTATKSASITTNNWYNHAGPNFDWPDAEAANGASDGAGGSGVAGYYVYFGTDSGVNASESGSLVTESEYTASSLTSGETYYLRIQTIDEAGNFSSVNWAPYIYKYDSEVPANPSTVTVDPPGYTNTNSFLFEWSGATDSASLISEYCYKTGEDGSTDTCIEEASISGALAYKTGTNTFKLRAKDNAGNYASDYTTTSFYYSSVAPGAPQNLTASPTSSSTNEFAFSWDPPELFYGQQSGLRYYYSINQEPTSGNTNVVGLSETYLTADSYATQKGINTFYVVAKDEAGNLDYDTYASVEFTADTTAPGIARNIDISDVSIKETESWRLALSWDTPEATGSGVANYKIYRTTTEDADCTSSFTNFSFVATTSQTSYVDTGLEQAKTYYCVTSCDSTNECSAVSDTVSLYPDGRWRVAASMTASPSATVKTKTATITWSTNRTSNSFVQYGTASGNYGDEVGSSTHVTAHEVVLTGLEPGTTYYYKAIWTDEDGNTGESDELTFTTNPAPTVSTVKTSNVSISTAFVIFTIKNAIKASVEYGETLAYGKEESISTASNESTYTIQLDNLDEGTSYNYRIKAEDDEGNVYYSDNYTFETLPVPKILTLKVQQVVGMPTATLRIIWTSNTNISSIITYYPTATPSMAKDYINLTLLKTHEAIIKDLKDETKYTLVITGKDAVGNAAEYPAQKVKTATDFRAPLMENFNIETTITGVGDDARAKLAITWDTDEPATTQIEYGQGTSGEYSQTTQEDKALTTNHTVTVTGLQPAVIYHLRAVSKDKAKNVSHSDDSVIITPKSTKGALELVVENLSKTFGFLNGLNLKQ